MISTIYIKNRIYLQNIEYKKNEKVILWGLRTKSIANLLNPEEEWRVWSYEDVYCWNWCTGTSTATELNLQSVDRLANTIERTEQSVNFLFRLEITTVIKLFLQYV